MTKNETNFIRQIEAISSALAVWAQDRIQDGWSIADVKTHLRNVAKLTERD